MQLVSFITLHEVLLANHTSTATEHISSSTQEELSPAPRPAVANASIIPSEYLMVSFLVIWEGKQANFSLHIANHAGCAELRAEQCPHNGGRSERASTAAFSMLISLSILISSSFALSRKACNSSLHRDMHVRKLLSIAC